MQPVAPRLFGEFYESLFQVVEVTLLELLEIEQLIARMPDRAYELIELDLNRRGIAVLGALDEEHHQERHNRGGRIDGELPRIAEAEIRS